MSKRILVVEDIETIRDKHFRNIKADGFNAEVVTTQEAAKTMLDKKKYDLCLIEIKTPGLSGMELYDYLKKELPNIPTKVIFNDNDFSKDRSVSSSGKPSRTLISKPFTIDKLEVIIREAADQL